MKIAFLFPGQGSQYVGMCNELIRNYPIANEVFEEANNALNVDIKSMILDGNMDELTKSENAQPAVVTASYAFYNVLFQQTHIQPFCAVGHSLGEISALICADSIPFDSGLRFVRERGKLMYKALQEKKGRAGIAIDISENDLQDIIFDISKSEYVTISGYNSPRQFVISGTQSGLRQLEKAVDKAGGEFIPFRMMPMKADAPYHSELMSFIKDELYEAIKEVKFFDTNFDVWSTVTGSLIDNKDSIKQNLCNQLIEPVYWNQVLSEITSLGVELFIDIGPQQIIRNLVKENSELPNSLAFDEEFDMKKILKIFSKNRVVYSKFGSNLSVKEA